MFSCAKMHLMQKCCVFCFAKNKDAYILLVQKCIFAKQNVTNAFDAILRSQMHFDFEHFPKENVQQNMLYASNAFLQAKMHFGKNAFLQNKM